MHFFLCSAGVSGWRVEELLLPKTPMAVFYVYAEGSARDKLPFVRKQASYLSTYICATSLLHNPPIVFGRQRFFIAQKGVLGRSRDRNDCRSPQDSQPGLGLGHRKSRYPRRKKKCQTKKQQRRERKRSPRRCGRRRAQRRALLLAAECLQLEPASSRGAVRLGRLGVSRFLGRGGARRGGRGGAAEAYPCLGEDEQRQRR